MKQEEWKFDKNNLSGNIINVILALSSSEEQKIQKVIDRFEMNPFLSNHAQGYEQYPLTNSYKREEYGFLKSVCQTG